MSATAYPYGGRIEGSRAVPADRPAVVTPELPLAAGSYAVETAKSGLPVLVDDTGFRWGTFANSQLALETSARLSR